MKKYSKGMAIVKNFKEDGTDKIFDEAKTFDLKEVMIIGWDRNNKISISFSTDNMPRAIWLLENAKFEIMKMAHNIYGADLI